MTPVLKLIGFVSLMGPPHAVFLHQKAHGTGSELDGRPLWLVVAAEFAMRACIFMLLVYGVQESLGRETFHRYALPAASVALGISGALHTFIYYLAFGFATEHLSDINVHRIYRLGRNWTYSVPPALVAGLLAMWWRDLRNLPLYEFDFLLMVVGTTWLTFLVIGTVEAVVVKRTPTGLEEDVIALSGNRCA